MTASQWVDVADVDDIELDDVMRFDHADATYAVYRTADGRFSASQGLCTHAQVHLCDGFVIGDVIECPKHNGRFDVFSGRAKGAPAVTDLRVFATRVLDGRLQLAVPVFGAD